jgi:adenosylhomocysteine nucleosidase
MFGIVVALYSEAENLINKVEDIKEFRLADKKAYSGTINGHPMILAISGIGKVSAALTTQIIIDKYNPDFILNFGTAGGMNKSVSILNYYAIEKSCQFDFDLRELDGVPLGYIQEYDSP